MSTEAATDYDLLRNLLAAGMDCMRINCAHDNEEAWAGMIRNLQKARGETGRHCRILMDVPGLSCVLVRSSPGPAVMKCRPKRDELGRVSSPVRLWLIPTEVDRKIGSQSRRSK